jgi:hypothetical protein
MNRIVILTALGVSSLLAQDTLSTEAKQRWTQTKNNLIAAAEKMDEANYDFKPAAESQSFKVLVSHTADSAMGTCSAFNGSPQKLGAASLSSKAELVEALKKGLAECDTAYGGLTDAKATEMVEARGAQRSRLTILWGNTVHMEHEYAQMAVHLRLKGVVPPSSERGMGGKGGKK